MDTVSELSNQLFSKTLLNSRELKEVSFEDEELPAGAEASLVDHGVKSYNLCESIGLLGLHHPLHIKSSLKSVQDPRVFCSREEVVELCEDITNFFDSILSINCKIGPLQPDALDAQGAGRYNRFLSEKDIDILNNKKVLNIKYALPFAFSLNLKKDCPQDFLLTTYQLYLSQKLMRLFKNGPFYKEPFIFKKRSLEVHNIFQSHNIECSVDGLSVSLNEKYDLELLSRANVKSDGHRLYLPLLFATNTIEEIAKCLKEIYVCH